MIFLINKINININMNNLYENNHLKKVNMTYFQHFKRASKLSYLFCIGSVKMFVHAVIPNLYYNSGSIYKEKIEKEFINCKKQK